jgi:hypothetical protein
MANGNALGFLGGLATGFAGGRSRRLTREQEQKQFEDSLAQRKLQMKATNELNRRVALLNAIATLGVQSERPTVDPAALNTFLESGSFEQPLLPGTEQPAPQQIGSQAGLPASAPAQVGLTAGGAQAGLSAPALAQAGRGMIVSSTLPVQTMQGGMIQRQSPEAGSLQLPQIAGLPVQRQTDLPLGEARQQELATPAQRPVSPVQVRQQQAIQMTEQARRLPEPQRLRLFRKAPADYSKYTVDLVQTGHMRPRSAEQIMIATAQGRFDDAAELWNNALREPPATESERLRFSIGTGANRLQGLSQYIDMVKEQRIGEQQIANLYDVLSAEQAAWEQQNPGVPFPESRTEQLLKAIGNFRRQINKRESEKKEIGKMLKNNYSLDLEAPVAGVAERKQDATNFFNRRVQELLTTREGTITTSPETMTQARQTARRETFEQFGVDPLLPEATEKGELEFGREGVAQLQAGAAGQEQERVQLAQARRRQIESEFEALTGQGMPEAEAFNVLRRKYPEMAQYPEAETGNYTPQREEETRGRGMVPQSTLQQVIKPFREKTPEEKARMERKQQRVIDFLDRLKQEFIAGPARAE